VGEHPALVSGLDAGFDLRRKGVDRSTDGVVVVAAPRSGARTLAGQPSWSRKKIEAQPLSPGCKLRLMVHLQAGDRRSANRGQSFDLSAWSCRPEVLLPEVSTGMKKEDNRLARRVKAAAMCGFAKITGAARKRQIAEVV
jgi:hypothetical protein